MAVVINIIYLVLSFVGFKLSNTAGNTKALPSAPPAGQGVAIAPVVAVPAAQGVAIAPAVAVSTAPAAQGVAIAPAAQVAPAQPAKVGLPPGFQAP
eukprot:COSAG02_NODE_13421_length_1397_cov_1.171032_3_plen_96_part_00